MLAVYEIVSLKLVAVTSSYAFGNINMHEQPVGILLT
jgi:hypothetical protein